MVKGLKLVIILCLCSQYCMGSQTDEARQIAKIKSDTSYLYAEATMKDLSEAVLAAKSILEVQVSDWVKLKYPQEEIDVCIAKAKEHCFEVHTQRGNYQRALVYIKKTDIMPVIDRNEIVVFQVSEVNAQSVTDNQLDEERALNSSISESAQEVSIIPPSISDGEAHMASLKNFYELEPYITDLQQKGIVKAFGKYKDMPRNTDCYLFIYNRKGDVVAVLRHENGIDYNLRTLQTDQINNYKECGAIWLQTK